MWNLSEMPKIYVKMLHLFWHSIIHSPRLVNDIQNGNLNTTQQKISKHSTNSMSVYYVTFLLRAEDLEWVLANIHPGKPAKSLLTTFISPRTDISHFV